MFSYSEDASYFALKLRRYIRSGYVLEDIPTRHLDIRHAVSQGLGTSSILRCRSGRFRATELLSARQTKHGHR
jgi:hypothetical protein